MTTIANLEVELNLDSGQFTGRLAQSGQAIQVFGRQIESGTRVVDGMQRQLHATAGAVQSLQRTLLGFTGFEVMRRSMMGLIEAQKTMQRIKFGLAGALGDAHAGAEALEYVRGVSEQLGLNLAVTATEFTKLTAAASAMGVPMKQQQAVFEGFARSATVLHLSADQQKYAMMALSQMFSKGKIQAEELRRQLGEQIPGAAQHFQMAVMKVIEGTELAGNSFDDLLRKGLLTTDRFLPQMIEALNKTGRGWEEAANSLQANLGRLGNAWLELKNDLGGGLFNDTMIAGAGFMADHLRGIADAIILVGAAFVTRMIGPQAQAFAQGIQMQRAWGSAIREDAQRTFEAAKSSRNAAMAKASETARRLENMKAIQAENVARLEAQRLQRADAIANMEGNFGTRMAYLRRRGQMPAEVEVQSRRTIVALLRAQQATTAQIAAAEAELAAATAAEAQAQRAVMLAQRQRMAAQVTLMGTALSGLQKAGSMMLSLVGGPFGLAILAIGAIGVSMYNAMQREKEWHDENKKHAQSMGALRVRVGELTSEFDRLGGSQANLRKMASAWFETSHSLDDASKRVAELEKRITHLKTVIAARNQEGLLGKMFADGDTNELHRLQDELINLQAQTNPLKRKFEDLQGQLKQSMNPRVFEEMLAAAKRLDEGATFEQILEAMPELEQGMAKAHLAFVDMAGALENQIFKMNVDLMRKQQGEYKAWLAEEGQKLMEMPGGVAGMDPADRARFNAYAAQVKTLFDRMEQYKASRKAATEAEREAQKEADKLKSGYDGLMTSLAQQTEQAKDALEADNKLTTAQKLHAKITLFLEENRNKLTDAMVRAIKVADEENLKLGEQVRVKENLKKADQELMRLRAQLAADRNVVSEQMAADLMQITHGAEYVEMVRRKIDIEKDYAAKLKELRDQNIAEDSDSYRNQRAEIEAHYQWRLAAEQTYQEERRAAEGDWRNGFRSAMEDQISQARNAAELTKNATTSAWEEMKNSLLELVNTGKLSWRSLTTFILKEIQRVLMAKATAALANLVMGLFGPTVSTAVNPSADLGGSTYGMSNTYSGAVLSANGNVMTSAGPAKLNFFENGGIARSPQLSIFGEGRLPEAYVPLPDGRSIPVTMKGALGSAGTLVQVSVNVDNSGHGNVETRGDANNDGKMLGEMVGVKVKEVINQEMRPGGILWRRQHG